MRNVVIVEAFRTPVGRRKGLLSSKRPDEMLAATLKETVAKAGIDPAEIDDVIAGCVTQIEEQAPDIARTAALMADFPITVPGVTLDRQCGSSLQAIHFGAQAIMSGDMDTVIACGVESMTRVPMFKNLGEDPYSPDLTRRYEMINQGLSAERIAEQNGFSRQDLDAYAAESHRRALLAQEAGYFDDEMLPMAVLNHEGEHEIVSADEGPRPGSNEEVLAGLQPAFREDGVITAGNASQMSDGAAAVLLMAEEHAESLGLKPLARLKSRVVVGSDPTMMLTGPVPATRQALKKAGMELEAIDLVEVNEAFAPVPLHWLNELNGDREKLNKLGGAIALGHPLGATGARITTTLVHEMKRSGAEHGLIAICEGLGMANATILENLRR
ncbi:thiolase family protein [Salsuginibacillus kocurii]|uniref:thiolase family protein n=1 Tax=Salsuginibacillus kocurii TaxID=427078 RepID=UPI00035EECA0|nr:thiolase family protein [Salsuginibacillus kocurii]